MKRINNLGRKKTQALLKKAPFFEAFTHSECERIIDSDAAFFVANEGEYIIKQESLDTAFYVLMSGEAFVLLNGHDALTATVQPGDFFGEIAFIQNAPRTSNVIANEICIMLRIDRALLNMLTASVREKIKDKVIEKLVAMVTAGNHND